MIGLPIWTISLLIFFFSPFTEGKKSPLTYDHNETDYGLWQVTYVMDALCWYEYLKLFPPLNIDYFKRCSAKGRDEWSYFGPRIKSNPRGTVLHFAHNVDVLLDKFPPEYNSTCRKFLKEPRDEPAVDESKFMMDKPGIEYPFKGFTHCLITTLRKRHGKKALDALTGERFAADRNKKGVIQIALDRMNEMRANHGVAPLQVLPELTAEAEKFAKLDAKECRIHCNESGYYKGEVAGKMHAVASPYRMTEYGRWMGNMGYVLTWFWYEGRTSYTYTDGYQRVQGYNVRDFIQLVWKDTKYVGLGLGRGDKCAGEDYLVAIYWPPGHQVGKFLENVLPPKVE